MEPATADPPETAVADATTDEAVEAGSRTLLTAPHELPTASRSLVRTLLLLTQAMYLAFYLGALANIPEIREIFANSGILSPAILTTVLVITAVALIPVRLYLFAAVTFDFERLQAKFSRLFPALLAMDLLWALSPFLLIHHISGGLALGMTAALVYMPFAQRSLVLMYCARPGAAVKRGGGCVVNHRNSQRPLLYTGNWPLATLPMSTTIRSFAKINLGLKIGAARADGFHELRTIYQTIALHDVVRVEVQPGDGIEIRCEDLARALRRDQHLLQGGGTSDARGQRQRPSRDHHREAVAGAGWHGSRVVQRGRDDDRAGARTQDGHSLRRRNFALPPRWAAICRCFSSAGPCSESIAGRKSMPCRTFRRCTWWW